MSDHIDQDHLDELADQANLDGYDLGYQDGHRDAAAAARVQVEDLYDDLRLILWRHHQALAARDASIQPPQVLGIYRHTLAELRRLIDP